MIRKRQKVYKFGPCPWCKNRSQYLFGVYSSIIGDWCVECKHCWARGPSRLTPQEAIEAWNNRRARP